MVRPTGSGRLLPTATLPPTGVYRKVNGKLLAPQQKEPIMQSIALASSTREPWNKGKLVRQKTPFKLEETWAIRVRFAGREPMPGSCLFNLAIDSKLRGL